MILVHPPLLLCDRLFDDWGKLLRFRWIDLGYGHLLVLWSTEYDSRRWFETRCRFRWWIKQNHTSPSRAFDSWTSERDTGDWTLTYLQATANDQSARGKGKCCEFILGGIILQRIVVKESIEVDTPYTIQGRRNHGQISISGNPTREESLSWGIGIGIRLTLLFGCLRTGA